MTAIEPILARCLGGEISEAVALAQMLIATADTAEVEAALATLVPDGAKPLQERARLRRLRRLARDNRDSIGRIAALLRDGLDHASVPVSADAGIAACRAMFDRAAQAMPEASVALYSLGNPQLLAAATAEIVAKMREWRLLGPDRALLEIGCGIGRFPAALAGAVGSITGIDVSPVMIALARERCAGLAKVRLLETDGRSLAGFASDGFDMVFAVDSFPYLHQAGAALVERHVVDAARILRPGGDLLILNFSYGNDLGADQAAIATLASAAGFALIRNGTRDFRLWDGASFHLRRRL